MNKTVCVLFSVVAMIALVVSCDDDHRLLRIDTADNPVTLRFSQSARMESQPLEFQFEALINEGRCPFGAMCFWPGMAEIQLRVIRLPADTHHIVLPISGSVSPRESLQQMPVDTLGYRFTLVNLLPYPSIDTTHRDSDYVATFTVFPFEPVDSLDGEAIITDANPIAFQIHPYTLDSMSIDGYIMNVSVTYSGGCENHYFQLFMSPALFAYSDPPQADLYLRHSGRDDLCEAIVTRHLRFDLRPIAHYYQLLYRCLGPIGLNLYEYYESTPGDKLNAIYQAGRCGSLSILPMAIGNYWVYAETTWTDHGMVAKIDSIEVIGKYTDSTGDWWKLSQQFSWLNDSIMVRGDTIFSADWGWTGPYPVPEYIPAADTSFRYNILRGDMMTSRVVSPIDSTITVPAGTFRGTYEYSGRDLWWLRFPYRVYLAPGVGFLYLEMTYTPTTPNKPYYRKSHLLRYHLE